MDQTPMTPRGEDLLRKELQRLKTVERPRIVAAIAEARSHGDLSENAEYDAAKEEQGLCEARIKDIEGKLASANVIDVSKLKTPNGGKLKVIFGATGQTLRIRHDSTTRDCYMPGVLLAIRYVYDKGGFVYGLDNIL